MLRQLLQFYDECEAIFSYALGLQWSVLFVSLLWHLRVLVCILKFERGSCCSCTTGTFQPVCSMIYWLQNLKDLGTLRYVQWTYTMFSTIKLFVLPAEDLGCEVSRLQLLLVVEVVSMDIVFFNSVWWIADAWVFSTFTSSCVILFLKHWNICAGAF